MYDDSTVITLTANADPSSTFSGRSGPGTCAVTMDGEKAVTATFVMEDTDYEVYLPFVTGQSRYQPRP